MKLTERKTAKMPDVLKTVTPLKLKATLKLFENNEEWPVTAKVVDYVLDAAFACAMPYIAYLEPCKPDFSDSSTSVSEAIASGKDYFLYEDDLCCHGNDDNEEEWEKHKLTRQKFWHALAVFRDDFPKHFDRILTGQYDANDADLLLQVMLFGEEVYC